MSLINEVRRSIRHINNNLPLSNRINNDQIENYVKQTINNLKSGCYDFSTYESIVLKQGIKKRHVKMYKHFSTENILCQYIKQILDRQFKVKYPNRNKVVHTLFDLFKAVKQMSEFTIIKFDFKDYFNSVSSVYVFEKYIKGHIPDRSEAKLIDEFTRQTKYAFTGLKTSNLISEIIAIAFDELVRQAFSQYGLLFLERYIDDTIVILNQHMEETICLKILNDALQKIYYDTNIKISIPCKTKLNTSKFKMVTRRLLNTSPASIDFLGYEFFFSIDQQKKIVIQYGITEEKQNKYNRRIDAIIEDYRKDNDIELLRHRILAFASRIVYVSREYGKNTWKVKGLINNYGELRYFIGTSLLHQNTEYFLKNMIEDAFHRHAVPIPYFLKNTNYQRGYNLFMNMAVNKTLLLVEHVGYDKTGLEKLCSQININVDRKRYGNLVRLYLMKSKVGY